MNCDRINYIRVCEFSWDDALGNVISVPTVKSQDIQLALVFYDLIRAAERLIEFRFRTAEDWVNSRSWDYPHDQPILSNFQPTTTFHLSLIVL